MTASTVPEAAFDLHYDGPALVNNRMEVRDIAPAMIAAADAIRAASRTLYPDQAEPRIDVEATAPGSFIVQLLILEAEAPGTAVSIFASAPAVAGATFITLVGSVIGAVKLVRRLSHTQIREVTAAPEVNPPAVRITFADGTVLEISESAYRLAQDSEVRRQMRNMVEPLSRPGVESLDLKSGANEARVERDDLPSFDLSTSGEELLSDTTRPAALTLASVAFAEGNKWRLSDGETTFYATVEDNGFLGRVARNEESFARSDILRTQLRTRQWRTDRGLRTEHIVVSVDEHIKGPREVPLPFVDE